MEPIKATDVRIFPHRRLKPETTEKILNELLDLDGVLRFLVNGESLPKIVGYGPQEEPVLTILIERSLLSKEKKLNF